MVTQVIFNFTPLDSVADWPTFFENTSTEAIQWHQYNIFSHALTVRLALRYKDKQVSWYPRIYKVRYGQCQKDLVSLKPKHNNKT